jgi:CHAD domain-containing protein
MSKDITTPELTAELLAKPAAHAVRVIALARLAAVRENYDRFAADDTQDLHDLRVALRRLRSWLRAFRPDMRDTVSGKTRRRLKALAAATNAARDAEVALQWIAAQDGMPSRTRSGCRSITDSLERERDAAMRSVRDTLDRDLPRLVRKLTTQLEFYWERRTLDASASPRLMAPVVADALRDHQEQLASTLARIASPDDADEVHLARIAAKRLRYLLESLDEQPDTADVLEQLRAMQRQLGEIRDVRRLAARLVSEIGDRAARDARHRVLARLGIGDKAARDRPSFSSLRSGLVELERRARVAEDAAFAAFRKQWSKRNAAALFDAVETISGRY